MKYLLFILITLSISACGHGANDIDLEFQPLYDQFIMQANQNNLNLSHNQGISIKFASLNTGTPLLETVAECMNVGWGNSQIVVDSNYWHNDTDAYAKQIIIYHELGHCVLDEIHTTDLIAIMNPIIDNPYQYPTFLPLMIQALFEARGNGG